MVDLGAISLDGLEEGPETILEAAFRQRSVTEAMWHIVHVFGSIFSDGDSFSLFSPFSASSMGYACPGAVGEWRYGVGQAGVDTGAAGRGGPQVVHFRVLELRDLTVARAWISRRRRPDY